MSRRRRKFYLEDVRTSIEASAYVSEFITQQIKEKRNSSIGFISTEDSLKVYEFLGNNFAKFKTSWAHARLFNLNEFVGLTTANPITKINFLHEHLIDKIRILPNNISSPKLDNTVTDYHGEIVKFIETLNRAEPFDLQVIFVGPEGELGFNYANSTTDSQPRIVDLSQWEISNIQNMKLEYNEIPQQGFTVGMSSILNSKTVLLIVIGEDKKPIMQKILDGVVDPQYPVTHLLSHKDLFIVTDTLQQKKRVIKNPLQIKYDDDDE